MSNQFDFEKLVLSIINASNLFQQSAVKAVNKHLTLRNWLIGFYIIEFEQNGSDRAKYGVKLLVTIAQNINIKGLTHPELSRCRQFYHTYPQILGLLPQEFKSLIPFGSIKENDELAILGLPIQESEVADLKHISNITQSISYSHFVELIKLEDEVKRRFYELLILKTQPSVIELKRQIASLTFERVGLSSNLKPSLDEVASKIKPQKPLDMAKSHYFFEFLQLPHSHLVEEKDLEHALISQLQKFMTELGNGFCFEARQKRILIDDEYFFIDLVFYHRILKCHVLVELKTDVAKYENIGQLKVYLQHYKRNVQEGNDNPPVGILLVTSQNKTLVEYAVADNDLEIFVSQYQLQLPEKSKLEAFINNELNNIK